MVGEWLGVAPYPLSMPLPSLVADVDVHCFSHEGFGVGGALRPEAIVQVALQVAFYRYGGEGLSIRGYTAWWLGGTGPRRLCDPGLPPPRAHGSLCASCEPTSLRHVLPGCTDLLRPPGPPCLALARALDDPHAEVGRTSCPDVKWGRDFLPWV